MRIVTLLTTLTLLAACGAAGEPQRPNGGGATDGIVFSGEARTGLTYNSAPALRG